MKILQTFIKFLRDLFRKRERDDVEDAVKKSVSLEEAYMAWKRKNGS